ncbi:MAG TPA: hypothetical protein VMH50_07590 [Thermoleophilia bacterium]|nr:hypothetical protein [Thermoleophilia bacterium]
MNLTMQRRGSGSQWSSGTAAWLEEPRSRRQNHLELVVNGKPLDPLPLSQLKAEDDEDVGMRGAVARYRGIRSHALLKG